LDLLIAKVCGPILATSPADVQGSLLCMCAHKLSRYGIPSPRVRPSGTLAGSATDRRR